MTDALQGKVAVVTGATSGIGEATARQLAQAGVAVALAGRRAERLEALAKDIENAGGKAIAVATDVTKEDEAKALVERTNAELGRLDILVNNAGVMLLGPVQDADTEEWRRMVDVNLMGLLYCTHSALPIMREQQSGHIVNVSSVAGRTASLGVAVYNATKWGVVGFSEGLRQEVLHLKVRVTVIEPGYVVTELQAHSTNPMARAAIDQMEKDTEAPLQAQDIADAIFYAVSRPQHVNVNEILVRPLEQSR
jgi:NADP-dependent 3-hydroxy acid dehydrogenase YdfG